MNVYKCFWHWPRTLVMRNTDLLNVTQHPSRTDGGLKPVAFLQGLLSQLNCSATVLEYLPLSLPCSAQVVLASICTNQLPRFGDGGNRFRVKLTKRNTLFFFLSSWIDSYILCAGQPHRNLCQHNTRSTRQENREGKGWGLLFSDGCANFACVLNQSKKMIHNNAAWI